MSAVATRLIKSPARMLDSDSVCVPMPFALADFATHDASPALSTTHARFERLKLVECQTTKTLATHPAIHQSSEELQTAITAMHAAATELQSHRDHILEQAQIESIKLGIAIAERLLRRTLNTQPESILDLVKTTLNWVVGTETVQIRLHPNDCGLIETYSDALARECSADIQLIADASLSRGDCLMETAQGTIDGRIETMLQRIAEELLD